jgi:hypothetical protein
MQLDLSTYEGTIKSGRGRGEDESTVQLRAAIMTSLETGKAQLWRGAGRDAKRNAAKLQNIRTRVNTERAEKGQPRISLDTQLVNGGADLGFQARLMKSATAAIVEPTPEPEAPTPEPVKATKATPAKKATPRKR